MILGILLGLMSMMLLGSLAISVYLYTKGTAFNLMQGQLVNKIALLESFKEQALVEITQLKNTNHSLSLDEVEKYMEDSNIENINKKQRKSFEEEYLSVLENSGL